MKRPKRVFVDHSGYHLLNMGDSAMLQSALRKLNALWPDATFSVVTYAPDRLHGLFPSAIPIMSKYHRVARSLRLPSKLEYGPIQVHKIAAPRTMAWWRSSPRTPASEIPTPTTLMRALAESDIVLSTGGGFINSTFWIHAMGVLEAIRYAQRQGKPTALLGQGLGPFVDRNLPDWAARTLRQVDVIALREGLAGPRILDGIGIPGEKIWVTGDDAVEMAFARRTEKIGDYLGLNVRSSGYAGAAKQPAVLAEIGSAMVRAAEMRGARIMPVPISFYGKDADMAAIQQAIGQDRTVPIEFDGIPVPDEIIGLASACRVIVTGSYHAAVFGAAQGIPVVCLTGSKYYDVKFAGLANLFPSSCTSVNVRRPHFAEELVTAVLDAWDRAEEVRADGLEAARGQIQQSNAAYAALNEIVEAAMG